MPSGAQVAAPPRSCPSASAPRRESSPCAMSRSLRSGAPHHLQQELEHLEVARRFGQVAAPGVEPVPADEEAVGHGLRAAAAPSTPVPPRRPSPARSRRWAATRGARGCSTPLEALQHLVALDGEPARRRRAASESSVLHSECVCSTAPAPRRAHDGQVEARLRGGPARPAHARARRRRSPGSARRSSRPLSAPLRRDGQAQRLAADHGAEVAAGAQGPAAGVRAPAQVGDRLGRLEKGGTSGL